MDLVLAYDVSTETLEGRRRLRRMAKLCESYGVRVQNSVFDLVVNPHEFEALAAKIDDLIDPAVDGVRVYRLQGRGALAAFGLQRSVSTTRGPLIL